MGSAQSSHSDAPLGKEGKTEVRGRDATIVESTIEEHAPSVTESSTEHDDLSNEESSLTSEEEENDEDIEDEDELAERLLILKDAKKLKTLATLFIHVELPVEVDPCAKARCYFDRPSAPPMMDMEEAELMEEALDDASKLKKLAADYAHPERPVIVSDPTACGRNFFDRPSAPKKNSTEDDEERTSILKDLTLLKKAARDYLHPEVGVTTTDPTAFGRNYFDRPSAIPQESQEEERAFVLQNAAALKKLAADFAHPERGVVNSDPTSYGRNYFSRPQAPSQIDSQEAEEQTRILADAAALKKQAIDYAHPEVGVTINDSTAFGRNYFSRPSAPVQQDSEDLNERARILGETAALKKLAMDYGHPEVGVTTTDPAVFGRNYFSRPSAPEQEDSEERDERYQILSEMAALKRLAVDYSHPEFGVTNTDPTSFGRNYFSRPSAPEQEDLEDSDERAQIISEMATLKKLAVDYSHPEVSVITTDPKSFGRNYFSRPSAPEQEGLEDSDERAQIISEMVTLKKLAVDYSHPEVGVTATEPTAFGRNFFSRPSAPEQEGLEESDERAQILKEMAKLKRLAMDYSHPEVGVTTTDPTVFGRNYFSRPSAPEQESIEESEEKAHILDEMATLEKLVIGYTHPEMGVPLPMDPAAHLDFSCSTMDHDHFEMDEDIDFDQHDSQQLKLLPTLEQNLQEINNGTKQEEGNLSRSPSCVMLFGPDF